MQFYVYQQATKRTAIYPGVSTARLSAIEYCALGLAGEAGEIANKVKKLVRDGDNGEKRKAIRDEVGDVLWYASQLLSELGGFSLDTVAADNLKKLAARKKRGTLQGSGDNR